MKHWLHGRKIVAIFWLYGTNLLRNASITNVRFSRRASCIFSLSSRSFYWESRQNKNLRIGFLCEQMRATATRYYNLIRDVMSSDCIYYGTGTSTSVGCPDHLGHFFCLVYVGCGGQLGHFFYLISRPVGIFLLMGDQTSWDITSIECSGKVRHFFCWVSRLVGTCFLLGAWMSLF